MEAERKPLCIDLFCGLGGWAEGFVAEGYEVVGFDIDPRFAEPYEATGGHFVCADVRDLDGREFQAARCIVASPPCNEFSRLRFLRKDAPPPDMSLWNATLRLREASGIPTVIENVEGACVFVGPAQAHRGSWYLWGDVPLLFDGHLPPKVGSRPWSSKRFRAGDLLPDGTRPKIQAWGVPQRLVSSGWRDRDRSRLGAAKRAKIPIPLARAVARGFL